MGQDSNGGKWQLAFWIVTVLCVGGIVTITGYVVANDEKREKGDTEIRAEYKESDEKVGVRLEQKIESEVQKIEDKIDEIKKEQTAQKVQSAEILTIIKQVLKEVKE